MLDFKMWTIKQYNSIDWIVHDMTISTYNHQDFGYVEINRVNSKNG